MYCKKCGAPLSKGANFCGECGAEVKRMERKKKILLIITGAGVIILAAAIALGFVLKETQERRRYDSCLEEGNKYLEKLDFEKAETAYLAAIDIKPKQEEPYLELANVYIAQKEYKTARNILEKGRKVVAEGTGRIDEKIDEIDQLKNEAADTYEYEWAVEPDIPASDIYYAADYKISDCSLNESYLQFDSDYAIIWHGEVLGLIDMEGNILDGMNYNKIFSAYGSYMMDRIVPKYEPEYQQEWSKYSLTEGEIVPSFEIEAYGVDAFYYCDGLHEVKEKQDMSAEEPDVAIPVKKSSVQNTEDEEIYQWWTNLDGLYAIYYNGGLKTDFIYDECGSYSEGLMAVCQDGKWGYVNEQGEVIIPLEYDASWEGAYFCWEEASGSSGKREYCYAFSDGYVPLCKGGEWELRDLEGDIVIPSGTFEAIRPVHQGKCWVKKDGKWGVISLIKTDEMESDKGTKESEDTEDTDIEDTDIEETENIDDGFTEEQLQSIKAALGVPEDLETDIEQDEAYYWDAGQCWLVYISVYHDGDIIAAASVDADTGELVKDMWIYSGQ